MMGKPKIRFKGYNEDWEQRKLGDLVLDHNAGIYISKENYGEGINVIGVGNIYDSDIFNGEIYRLGTVNDDKFLLEEADIIYGESSLVPEGIARTVCVGKNGAGSAFAWHTRRVKLDNNIVNSHVATLELNYLHDVRKYLVSVSTQTALTGITTDGYFGTTLVLPSVEEQHKISDYFKSLDHLITLHQHKCDEMKKFKKCMLQKMFPKNGKKVPEIRFDGFTNDWEQRKLGEVFEQTTNFVNLSKDDIELWSLTVEDGLTPKSERYNREFLVKKDTNFKEVRPGDIVYNPMNMTLGAVGYNGMSKSVAISGYYTTMITKDGNDSYYINTWLKSPQAISLYKIYATGSLIEKQRVQFPTLSTIPAVFPKYEEQHKIGCYFEAIDHLITLHQHKCDELQNLKKYMLQNMFV